MKGAAQVRFRVTGLSAEKLMNAARAQGVVLRKVQRGKDRALTVFSSPKDYAALCALAKEKGYQVSESQPVGLLRLMQRLGGRWGLIAGAAVCAALVIFAMGFVWQVRIENAGAYAGEVRACLEEWGVRPGIRREKVDLSALREKLEWRLPRVKWVRTAWAGVALVVSLEEGTPPPDIESAGAPGDVVAGEDGLLSRLTVYAGTPMAKAGDFVRAGQVLIRGEERGKNGEAIPVKARGEAVARVWITVRVRLQLTETRSLPTGRTAERRTLQTPFFSWSSRDIPDFLTFDKEIRELPVGGAWLPVTLIKETYGEAALERGERDAEDVKREGAQAALLLLNQALGADETVDKWLNFSMIEGDTIVVEATAEASRDIGRYQKK